MDIPWTGGRVIELNVLIMKLLFKKNCKYSVFHNDTCVNLGSYVNILKQSNSIASNVNSYDVLYYELSPMLVPEREVKGGHCNVSPGHWGQLMTSDPPHTYDPCQVNGSQSGIFAGLQPHQHLFDSFKSM